MVISGNDGFADTRNVKLISRGAISGPR